MTSWYCQVVEKKMRCLDHSGFFFITVRRGRQPTRCTEVNPCTKAEIAEYEQEEFDLSDDPFADFEEAPSPAIKGKRALSREQETPAELQEFSLVAILYECYETEPYKPQDKALAHLAVSYAEAIDHMGDITKLGPALLTALESLQLSPRARAMVKKGVTGNEQRPKVNPLDELRERRIRKNGA